MAAHDKASRTEKPTGKRLAKARKEGQVARSVELNHTAVLVGVIAVLSFEAPRMLAKMEAIVHDGLARSGSPQLVGGLGLHALTSWGMRSFAGVVFQNPGKYSVVILVDTEEVGRRTLEVAPVTQSTTPPQ